MRRIHAGAHGYCGPIMMLWSSLYDVGWRFTPDLELWSDRPASGAMHLVVTDCDEVFVRLRSSWQRSCWRKVSARKDFASLRGYDIDVHTTLALHEVVGERDRGHLRFIQSAGLRLAADIARYEGREDKRCPCGAAVETPARRWLECPLQHRIKARANHLWIVNRANLLPEITKHWGIAVEDRAQLEAQDRQWALQEVAFQAPEYEQDDILTWPKRGKKRMQVFTDGSGAPAENAKWRRTGYGIALLDGLRHSAPATGRQSVPRAELQAAVVAAEAFRLPVDINTDCAYVCRVDANARMPFRKSPYLSSNGDLVARWKKMVSDNPDRVATTKIKAHRSLDDSKGSVDAMQIVYNDLADGAANKGRQMHESEWWNLKRYEAGRRRLVLDAAFDARGQRCVHRA